MTEDERTSAINDGREDADASADSELDLLRSYLALRSEACPSCGYELHALTSRRCPECGEILRLRVGLEHPNMGAFLTGLIGLAATAGFGGLFLLFGLSMTVLHGEAVGEMGAPLCTFSGIALVSSLLLTAWIKSSGRIRRAAPAKRGMYAALCWAYAGAVLVTVYLILGW